MIVYAGDLGVQADTTGNKPGYVLQRRVEGVWVLYLKGGQPVTWPLPLKDLESGEYRTRKK